MYFQGIDPISLDMLAREGIVALRRAKRRNMERYDHQESFLKSFFIWCVLKENDVGGSDVY